MVKKIPAEEVEKLVKIVERHSDGISIEGLVNAFEGAIPKRTLQYRLSYLVKTGILKKMGIGKGSKYYAEAAIEKKEISEPMKGSSRDSFIHFSSEALELRKLISVPSQLRQHVSYKKEFLESYEPNKTHYLSQEILEKLSKLGAGVEKGRPAGTYARKIYHRLLIDLSWNSSRLEGNTYSLLETERLLDTGEEAVGKDRTDAQMLLNHKDAIEFLVDMAEELDVNRFTILNIHGLLSNDLLLDPKACGRLRTAPVKIGKSVYHPVEIPQLIEECFQVDHSKGIGN